MHSGSAPQGRATIRTLRPRSFACHLCCPEHRGNEGVDLRTAGQLEGAGIGSADLDDRRGDVAVVVPVDLGADVESGAVPGFVAADPGVARLVAGVVVASRRAGCGAVLLVGHESGAGSSASDVVGNWSGSSGSSGNIPYYRNNSFG